MADNCAQRRVLIAANPMLVTGAAKYFCRSLSAGE